MTPDEVLDLDILTFSAYSRMVQRVVVDDLVMQTQARAVAAQGTGKSIKEFTEKLEKAVGIRQVRAVVGDAEAKKNIKALTARFGKGM